MSARPKTGRIRVTPVARACGANPAAPAPSSGTPFGSSSGGNGRPLRVATYVRVSTEDQTAANQVPEVEQLAAQRGTVCVQYAETGSAAKHRPAFEEMMSDARRGAFDVLVIWAIDRFGRSMVGNLNDLLDLDRAGVRVCSVRESWLDTSGPTRMLLVAMFSWVAEQERSRLIERTKAGMARARRHGTKSGKRIGRAPRHIDVDQARELMADGSSQRAAARALGVPLGTLQRALARKAA
jgi:putative DNA-invertase from lambdoid prophage Rac